MIAKYYIKGNLNLEEYMKEISGWEVLNLMFKESDMESCTFYDINMWSREYQEKNPGVYVDVTRDVMHSIPESWYYLDYQNNIFYKQITLKCPICDDVHYKYPENNKFKKLEKFYKIDKLHKKSKPKKEEKL